MLNNHVRAKRGEVGGWSESATRRNTRFLYSVQEQHLTGYGLALTLTLRDCPPSSDDWHRIRNAFIHRMKRGGMIRLHWVTEWQRRGVPHLHCAIWFDNVNPSDLEDVGRIYGLVIRSWMDLASAYGARPVSQNIVRITDSVGWFQYLSKHASRGVKHYQRSAASIPSAWEKTGRMWGHWGEWPTRDAIKIGLQGTEGDKGYYAFRRLVRAWRLADARASGDVRRVYLAKHVLSCSNRALSSVRGLSEWVPEYIQDMMLANLAVRGYSVTC